jgi:hypothetical protein
VVQGGEAPRWPPISAADNTYRKQLFKRSEIFALSASCFLSCKISL